MPKPRTKAEDIRNPEHYFNRYIALEVKHDQTRQQEIAANEVSLEEKMERNSFQHTIAVNKADEMLINSIIAKEPHGWLSLLNNERLQAALNELTPGQQEVVRLHFFEDLKLAEIAVVVGISKSAVTQRYQGAMLSLKKYFSEP